MTRRDKIRSIFEWLLLGSLVVLAVPLLILLAILGLFYAIVSFVIGILAFPIVCLLALLAFTMFLLFD